MVECEGVPTAVTDQRGRDAFSVKHIGECVAVKGGVDRRCRVCCGDQIGVVPDRTVSEVDRLQPERCAIAAVQRAGQSDDVTGAKIERQIAAGVGAHFQRALGQPHAQG